MSATTASTLEPKPAEYVQLWAESFSQVMKQIMAVAVPCLVQPSAPADLSPSGEDDLWALVTSAGALRGEMVVRVPPVTVLRLAQIFVGEPGAAAAEPTAEHREALLELLRQVSGIASTGAKARWGEVQLSVELAAAPSWPPAETMWLQASIEGEPGLLLEVGLSAALVAELRAGKIEAVKTAMDSSSSTLASEQTPVTGALDLLMDVQLGVTMRFGARRLLLREVLDLSPGAVVELDRRVQDPVELLLDGRLIARGEVVVIDGNYGLRVTDVSPLAVETVQHAQ